jgi:hypothetical protein
MMEVIETGQGHVVRQSITGQFIHENLGGGAGIEFVFLDRG